MKFEELNIESVFLKAVEDMGFEEMSPIQESAIPLILEGKDIIGQAQTGTGKTAAFGIPLLQRIDPEVKELQAIILCPTRELAIQVSDELHRLCKYTHGIKIVPVYGGADIVRQIKALKSGAQILVGTPGRTLDHMRRKTVKCGHVKCMVLDEADEMLDMGFREDIETVLKEIPGERQTMLFSATMPQPIIDIANTFMQDVKLVKVVKKELTVTNIEQYYYDVREEDKTEALCRLLDVHTPALSIIFCNTKLRVAELVNDLQSRGYVVEGLHGDMNQQDRLRVMQNCRAGKTGILIATDVAARGIDIEHVDAVFNYDLPQDVEYYVHRIGRTGRAGRAGMSFSFVTRREFYRLREIEKYCKTRIEPRTLPTRQEIVSCRVGALAEELKTITEQQDLHVVQSVMDELLFDSGLTSLQATAALLYKYGNLDIKEITPVARTERKHADRKGSRSLTEREPMARMFLTVGKRDGIKPGNILGAIAGESGVDGSRIGAIDMYDSYSFLDVPQEDAERILASMRGKRINGRFVRMELAGEEGRGEASGRRVRGHAGKTERKGGSLTIGAAAGQDERKKHDSKHGKKATLQEKSGNKEGHSSGKRKAMQNENRKHSEAAERSERSRRAHHKIEKKRR